MLLDQTKDTKRFFAVSKRGRAPRKNPYSPPREENSKGKMKAMIQTMDWFAWLEADDEDEEYEEE